MKFNVKEWLAKHNDDAEKALLALHQEVEDREDDNGKARADKREAERKLQDVEAKLLAMEKDKTSAPSAEDLQLLARYQALGKIEDLESELPTLRDNLESTQGALLGHSLREQLRKAGASEKYIETAVKVLMADDTYFEDGENDTVTLDVKRFKDDNVVFFDNSVEVLEGRGNDDKVPETFKDLANNHLKGKFAIPT